METRRAVSKGLKERRQRSGLTQAALAKKLESSQSRVAKMEAGDPDSVTDTADAVGLYHSVKEASGIRAVDRSDG